MRIEIFWTIGFILTVTAIIVFSSYSAFKAQSEKLKEGLNLNEPEWAGVGSRKRFPKPFIGR